MTDETDFLVVGVIGPVSVGKSTILNAIYGHKSGNGVAPFKTASTEKILSGSYQTNGVDIAVSPERVIVIDAQPLESTSMLVKFYKNEPQLMADCKTFEQMLHLIVSRVPCIPVGLTCRVWKSECSSFPFAMWCW